MFNKVLVANRGEIAVRVIRTCHDLGITAVAVYSDIDADSLHVRLADESYNVGPAPAAQSYLNIASILEAAKRSGAQAVHPGYGFLAENTDFARAVVQAGLAWVGPPAEVIASMGDKTAARRTAAEAGVAIVPGTTSAVRTVDEVAAFASEHGFPVAIKASAGGGGKGFRVVGPGDDLEEALAGAAREAQAYFSSDEVYLERYLQRPRHIEVQVLAEAGGAVLSFPERDCSLQRRHQKLVEESPSPALESCVREAIMEAAVRIATRANYRNAGTCEFLLDSDRRTFYFLEMNTRLQVEHPVTELVTGVDLVRAQLLIASGEALDFSESHLGLKGHAIECRLNAEDPARSFMPAPGTITAYREPAGPGVRVDSGVEPNSRVSQAYDPLLAKLITHGADREQARRRMLRALSEYEVTGIKTTIPFHSLLIADDRFVSGDYHTGTVEHELDLSLLADTPAAATPKPGEPDSIERTFVVEVNGKRITVRTRERLETTVRSQRPRPARPAGGAGAGSTEVLTAPMQGTIVKKLVHVGQEVEAGDPICVLEAMKMENSIVAHTAGTVEELKVEAGQSVGSGDVIAIIR